MEFGWNAWNLLHIAGHGVGPDEAEGVVLRARGAFPRRIDDGKWLVWGRAVGGRWLQVIYVLDPDQVVFIIHARPLTPMEVRRLRRRHRRRGRPS